MQALNELARERLRQAGQLGEDVAIQAGRGERLFAPGDRIMFLKNERSLGVKNGSVGTLENVSTARMAVMLDNGRAMACIIKQSAYVCSERGRLPMKLNLMSLGDLVADPYSGRIMTAEQRYRMIIDAAVIADRTGFNGINIGEHHGIDYTFSAPPVLLAAIAERTVRLRLGTAVALAANLDPLRLAEDYATVDVISGGRIDLVTGRGNFFESTYTLFGQSPTDSAARFAEGMELLCALWEGKPLRWTGKFRPPVNGESLQPLPVQRDRRPFWIGGGSSRETAELAGRLGLKLMLPSAFGRPDKFVEVADIYRQAYVAAGNAGAPEVGACWHGWVERDGDAARRRFEPRYRAYHGFTQALIKRVNPNPPPYLAAPFDYDFLRTQGPAIVGSPAEFAERLSELAEMVGADINLVKMDMGGVPREEFLDMIQLVGEEVIPLIGAREPAANIAGLAAA